MGIGSADRLKQIVAGLVVLADLALSAGQAVAVPSIAGWSYSAMRADAMQALTKPGKLASHRIDFPGRNHYDAHAFACCIAGDCLTDSAWLSVGASAELRVVRPNPTYSERVMAPPDSFGDVPALPPPRHRA